MQIPSWQTLLELGARCKDLTGLGYMGVDIVQDQNLGPLMLEINARPGLAIQIANRQGLQKRFDRIDTLNTIPAAAERAQVAIELFGETLKQG